MDLFQKLFDQNGGINGNGKNQNDADFIQLKNIVKTFKSAAGEFEVLKNVSADINRGEFVGVIGKSGSGKSTLINMITGIDHPTSGEVIIGGMPVHHLNENKMAIWRGKNLGIVFQFFQLLPTLSLVENIMLPMDFCNMYKPRQRYERAMNLLTMVEMEDHAHKLPSAVSGGQQQRVAIARSLANDPPIVIADEPTGNLDSQTAEAIFMMFEGLIRSGKTIIMVTHDSSLARRVSRTILIADGEIVNEWVAKALPTFTLQQMLKVTKELEPMRFNPGQELIMEGEVPEHVFLVTKGYVEVSLKRPHGHAVVVSRIGPGQYVGEIEAIHGRKAIATVSAAEQDVEAYALDREKFQKFVTESDATHEAVIQVVEQRQEENLAARTNGKPA